MENHSLVEFRDEYSLLLDVRMLPNFASWVKFGSTSPIAVAASNF